MAMLVDSSSGHRAYELYQGGSRASGNFLFVLPAASSRSLGSFARPSANSLHDRATSQPRNFRTKSPEHGFDFLISGADRGSGQPTKRPKRRVRQKNNGCLEGFFPRSRWNSPLYHSPNSSSRASCSASANREIIPGVAFQAILPLVLRYRMASPASSNSRRIWAISPVQEWPGR
jgi:hypothetical protein